MTLIGGGSGLEDLQEVEGPLVLESEAGQQEEKEVAEAEAQSTLEADLEAIMALEDQEKGKKEAQRPLEEDLEEEEEKAPKAQAKEGGEEEAEKSQETPKKRQKTVEGSPSCKVQYSLQRILGISPHEKPVLEEKMLGPKTKKEKKGQRFSER